MTIGNSFSSDTCIRCPPNADEQVDWQFGKMPGWSRTDRDGSNWNYYGPLDEFGREHLLRHFGLEAHADEFPLAKLRFTAPSELRALTNRSGLRLVASA
jgi:hypothetical protein